MEVVIYFLLYMFFRSVSSKRGDETRQADFRMALFAFILWLLLLFLANVVLRTGNVGIPGNGLY